MNAASNGRLSSHCLGLSGGKVAMRRSLSKGSVYSCGHVKKKPFSFSLNRIGFLWKTGQACWVSVFTHSLIYFYFFPLHKKKCQIFAAILNGRILSWGFWRGNSFSAGFLSINDHSSYIYIYTKVTVLFSPPVTSQHHKLTSGDKPFLEPYLHTALQTPSTIGAELRKPQMMTSSL